MINMLIFAALLFSVGFNATEAADQSATKAMLGPINAVRPLPAGDAGLPPPLPKHLSQGVIWQVGETYPAYHKNHIIEMEKRDISLWWNWLKPKMKLAKGMKVADVGCGTGNFSFPIAHEIGPTGKVFALDVQQDMIDVVKQRLLSADFNPFKNVEAKVSLPHATGLPPESLDLIVLINVHFHYYPDLLPANERLIQDIYESVKAGGRVLVDDGLDTRQRFEGGRPFSWKEVSANIIKHYTKVGFVIEQEPENYVPLGEVAIVFKRPGASIKK